MFLDQTPRAYKNLKLNVAPGTSRFTILIKAEAPFSGKRVSQAQLPACRRRGGFAKHLLVRTISVLTGTCGAELLLPLTVTASVRCDHSLERGFGQELTSNNYRSNILYIADIACWVRVQQYQVGSLTRLDSTR
jgi:hypothetical protein